MLIERLENNNTMKRKSVSGEKLSFLFVFNPGAENICFTFLAYYFN